MAGACRSTAPTDPVARVHRPQRSTHNDVRVSDVTAAKPGKRPKGENTSPRLRSYAARTQAALDLVALLTLWIVIVPVRQLGLGEELTIGGVIVRLMVSVIYGIDLVIRARLAPRHLEYVRTHPIALLAVIFPPIRVIFSLRLIRSLFRRGNITRFLIAAGILLINGAIIVYFYEYNAPDANITSPWASIWWAIVTVATVGYGDYYPVTVAGRIVASVIMAIGILTLAVITAQVSSSFVDQAKRRRSDDDASDGSADPSPEREDPPLDGTHVRELHERLARIEAQLAKLARSNDDEADEADDQADPPSEA